MWGIVIKIESSTPCISLRLLQQSYHGSTQSWISELHGQRYWTMWRFRLFIKLDTVLRSVINSFPIKKKKRNELSLFPHSKRDSRRQPQMETLFAMGKLPLFLLFSYSRFEREDREKDHREVSRAHVQNLPFAACNDSKYYQYLTEVSRVTVA